jgi:long-subunit fatty acid transport protein
VVQRASAVIVTIAILALSGCAAAAGFGAGEPPSTGADRAVTDAEALAFTESLIDAALVDSSPSFCEQFAANQRMCESSLVDGAESRIDITAWRSAELSARTSHSGSIIVTLHRDDGATSAIEVLIDAGNVRAVDPVFWVERTIVG